ncbi:MAG: restriction endonuclease subunit S [Pirellulaceae bacterium]|nr:restriction endonuclease subunit S [Pirellulaceae bacterium]
MKKKSRPPKKLGVSASLRESKNKDIKPTLVPKLRFPEFREADAWTLQSGDSLFDLINDRNPEPGLPVLAITQEHGAIPRHMIDYHVSVTEKSIESYKVVSEGDFIISLRSFQGGIEFSRYHGICSPAYVILRRSGQGSDEYFRHYFKTDRFIRILTKNLEGLRDGKMISYAQFSELQLPTPKPAEQQKIASCLSSLDELIELQGRKVDALKTHKKGLMQQLFPREGETQPRLRFPEFQNAGEWEPKLLGDVVKSFKTGKLDANAMVENGQYRFYTCARNYYQIDRYAFEGEALLVAGNGAYLGYIHHYIGKFNAYQRTYVLQEFEANVVFLRYLLDRYLPARIQLEKKDGNTPYIVLSTLTEMPLVIPRDKDELERIASCLSSLDALITAETQKFEALKTHKRGLMQQLFPTSVEA